MSSFSLKPWIRSRRKSGKKLLSRNDSRKTEKWPKRVKMTGASRNLKAKK